MKWLQNNPLGMALVSLIGVFLLTSLLLAIVRAWPVSTDLAEVALGETGESDSIVAANKAGPISDYQVINQKPVFNVTRRPAPGEVELEDQSDDDSIAVKDAPKVKLTGVIITPGLKIASLKPEEGDAENVMAKEGEKLTGEYVGWLVSSVNPRNVVLESRDGQTLELELQVHDVKISEPPKPVAPKATAQAENNGGDGEAGEDGQPLSRAEQIRQRIAERREELRREQEEQQEQEAQNGNPADTENKANPPPNYQSAIRAMIKNKSKDDSSDDN